MNIIGTCRCALRVIFGTREKDDENHIQSSGKKLKHIEGAYKLYYQGKVHKWSQWRWSHTWAWKKEKMGTRKVEAASMGRRDFPHKLWLQKENATLVCCQVIQNMQHGHLSDLFLLLMVTTSDLLVLHPLNMRDAKPLALQGSVSWHWGWVRDQM